MSPGTTELRHEQVTAGGTAVGPPLALPGGTRRGSLCAYMQDHDGVTLELIQLAPPEPRQPEGHTP